MMKPTTIQYCSVKSYYYKNEIIHFVYTMNKDRHTFGNWSGICESDDLLFCGMQQRFFLF